MSLSPAKLKAVNALIKSMKWRDEIQLTRMVSKHRNPKVTLIHTLSFLANNQAIMSDAQSKVIIYSSLRLQEKKQTANKNKENFEEKRRFLNS